MEDRKKLNLQISPTIKFKLNFMFKFNLLPESLAQPVSSLASPVAQRSRSTSILTLFFSDRSPPSSLSWLSSHLVLLSHRSSAFSPLTHLSSPQCSLFSPRNLIFSHVISRKSYKSIARILCASKQSTLTKSSCMSVSQ